MLFEGTSSPGRSDCEGRIKNPYYDEWKKVENEATRLDRAYGHCSSALFDLTLSEEEQALYLEELRGINAWVEQYTQKYSWAIPNDDALVEVAKFTPLIEIGAGTGYWAWLLRQLEVDILAFDKNPPGHPLKSRYHPTAVTWTEVLSGDESVLDSIDNRTLFLCWPPSNHPMAFNTLSRFRGSTFLFVGETWPSCATGNEDFFRLLDHDWAEEPFIESGLQLAEVAGADQEVRTLPIPLLTECDVSENTFDCEAATSAVTAYQF
jgi:hypothetical protein